MNKKERHLVKKIGDIPEGDPSKEYPEIVDIGWNKFLVKEVK